MKRIALLLSGQPRNVFDSFNKGWSFFIEQYKPDVYLHFWKEADYKNVLQCYKPKNYISLPKFDFESFSHLNLVKEKNYHHSLPLFLGWQSVINLINSPYDIVVRSRYDVIPQINLENINYKFLNVSKYHWSYDVIPDDNLMITNLSNAKLLYSNIYNDLLKIIDQQNSIYNPEMMLKKVIDYKNLNNILLKSTNINFYLNR